MHDLRFDSAVALNTLRKDGFLPFYAHLADSLARSAFGSASVLLPRSLAGEIREGEQAAIYQQPAQPLVHIRLITAWPRRR